MNKVNGNSENNLEALRAYYQGLRAKKTVKEEKSAETKPAVDNSTKSVEASALDATAAQIWGVQLSKVDKSDAATSRRLEKVLSENNPFMAKLNKLQGISEPADEFVAYAMANVKGVDTDKLAKYMNKPLSEETAQGAAEFLDALV